MSAVTPVMLSWSLMSVVLVQLLLRWGFRRVVTLGAVLSSFGITCLLAAAILRSPLWVLTAILFGIGIGFAPCAMGTMLGAQDAAEPQERGVVTSGVMFFRNFGGAIGVGLFGALFNLLTVGDIRVISGNAFHPGDLLDPHKLETVRAEHPELLTQAQSAIAHGLLWVFAGMLAVGLAMIAMSRRISAHKHQGKVHAQEVMEAMG